MNKNKLLARIGHLPEINLKSIGRKIKAIEIGAIINGYVNSDEEFLEPIYVAGKITRGRDWSNPLSKNKPLLICSKRPDKNYEFDPMDIGNQRSLIGMEEYISYQRL